MLPQVAAEKKERREEPEDHALGRSRGGWGTKIHLLVDGSGVPIAAHLTPGQTHESKGLEPLLDPWDETPLLETIEPVALAADKAYSSFAIHERIRHAGWKAVIPASSNQTALLEREFDKEAYRRRNVVERCVGWLKQCRRICTRYEKLAVSFKAMLQLAFLRLYLQMLAPTGAP